MGELELGSRPFLLPTSRADPREEERKGDLN